MPIPTRLLRAQADDLPGARPRLSTKDVEQQDRILATATSLFARFGRVGINLTSFACALRMSPLTIKRHFPDLDSILAEILRRHLQTIAAALGEVPFGATNRPAARRAAYVAHTRTGFNATTEAHLLLLRDRHALPPDLAEPIEQLRLLLGDMLDPANPTVVLTLLDTPELQPAQIETMLAALAIKTEPASTPPPKEAPPPWLKPANAQTTVARILPFAAIPPKARAGPLN